MNLRSLRAFLGVVVATLLLAALPARAQDYTDIWWAGAAEDGWGVNLIQSDNFIFATFFVYGPAPAKTPIWYAGNLTRQPNGSFAGGLYQTQGTGIGAPWNPLDHSVAQVGTVTFTPTDNTSGILVYTVNGTVVNKSIVRQTLTQIAIGGNYYGTAIVTHAGCSNAANNGASLTDFDPVVTQGTNGQLRLDFVYGGSDNCTLQGTYAQEGLLFRIPVASYSCSSGISTTGVVYEMKSTAIGLEGRWFVPNAGGGCSESGKFATVFPDP